MRMGERAYGFPTAGSVAGGPPRAARMNLRRLSSGRGSGQLLEQAAAEWERPRERGLARCPPLALGRHGSGDTDSSPRPAHAAGPAARLLADFPNLRSRARRRRHAHGQRRDPSPWISEESRPAERAQRSGTRADYSHHEPTPSARRHGVERDGLGRGHGDRPRWRTRAPSTVIKRAMVHGPRAEAETGQPQDPARELADGQRPHVALQLSETCALLVDEFRPRGVGVRRSLRAGLAAYYRCLRDAAGGRQRHGRRITSLCQIVPPSM